MKRIVPIVMICLTAFAAPPVAVDDTYSMMEGTTLTVPAPGLLANDSGGGTITAWGFNVWGPLLTVGTDGAVMFDPPDGWYGEVNFTYTVTNGDGNDSGAVLIVVNKKPWKNIKAKQLRVGTIGMR